MEIHISTALIVICGLVVILGLSAIPFLDYEDKK